MSEECLTLSEISTALGMLGLSADEVTGVGARIGQGTLGLLIYGSRARGDYLDASDYDLLRLTTSLTSPTFKCGRASVSSYTREQLRSASGTLFGTHLNRDGRVLVQRGTELTTLIDGLTPANATDLIARVARYSTILVQADVVKSRHCSGLVRLARYLLRTAVYASVMTEGPPCFSVRELAVRFGEPRLATLLASDPDITGPPSLELLDELTTRLIKIIGPLSEHGYGSLEALAVAMWDVDRNLAALAIRAGSEDNEDSINYSDLPKVLL